MAEQPTRRPKRADIQGLRALAVMLVVASHAGIPGFSGGFVGVDVFFVLSGFLITGLLVGEGERTGRISITGFYSRRARRILPAATLVLVATVVFTAIWEATADLKVVVTDAIWAAVFLANVHFASLGTNYSEGEDPSAMQHYWSLAVEEQFYLVWPLVLIALFALKASRRTMVLTVVGVWVVSLTWASWATTASPITAYFSSPARAYELATGALVAVAAPWLVVLAQRARTLLAVLGLAAVLLASLSFYESTPFPGWHALLPVLGTAAVLVAGTSTDEPPESVLNMRPFQHIGDLSYSIYLWHWPVLLLCEPHLGGVLDGWLGTVLLIAVTFGLSELSYRFVEVPFQHGHIPKMRTRFALALWPVSIALVLVTASLASSYGDAQLDESRKEAAAYYDEHPDALKKVSEKRVEKEVRQSLKLADRGAPVPPDLTNGDDLGEDSWQQQFTCYAGFDDSSSKICPVGDTEADKTVVLLGDSHAGMWIYALDKIGKAEGFKVVPLVKFGCVPYDVHQTYREDPFPSCPQFRDWSRDQVKKLEPDAIVLGHRGLNYVVADSGKSEEESWQDGVEKTVAELTDLSPVVRVLSDVPRLPFSPGSCITDAKSTMASCTTPVEGPEIEGNSLTRKAVAETDATYVPAVKLVCQAGRCPVVVGDTVTYRDSSHLSVTWTKVVAEELGEMLDLGDL